jgi:hypothetical protein
MLDKPGAMPVNCRTTVIKISKFLSEGGQFVRMFFLRSPINFEPNPF